MLHDRLSLTGQGTSPRPVTDDVYWLLDRIVNVYFVGAAGAGDRRWVLVDAGLQGSAHHIAEAAVHLYGPEARPAAIVLTHGHFDHVGSLRALADRWDVPVYAHDLELPYLTGRSSYPPPDPTVGGGLMARLSPLFPKGPFETGGRVLSLPEDGAVPGMPGWRWVFTPGHSPGHVSFFRDEDRTLIAGDAFVTTKQESMLAALTQRPEVHGPPMYFTPDWGRAGASVQRLAGLQPELAATGHGVPMRGAALRDALERLAHDFDRLAVPRRGRYVGHPAVMDRTGVVAVPPKPRDPVPMLVAGAAALVVGGLAMRASRRRDHGGWR